MLRVVVQPTLIEQFFRSGYKLGYLIEVLTGLPADAQLTSAAMENGLLALYFKQIRVPDEEVVDLAITLKSIRAIPEPERTPTDVAKG